MTHIENVSNAHIIKLLPYVLPEIYVNKNDTSVKDNFIECMVVATYFLEIVVPFSFSLFERVTDLVAL